MKPPSDQRLYFVLVVVLFAATAAFPFDLFEKEEHVTVTTSSHLRVSSRFLQEVEGDSNTTTCSASCCTQQHPCPAESSSNPFTDVPVVLQYVMIVLLVCLSALFSGLTLGLMGLDKTGLEIVMEGGNEKNAALAKIIYPVRKNGNQLLCTLLLGNTAVNALLSILMADKAGGIVGFLISTFTILILGEISPQALCSRYALEIGSRAVPLVRVIMVILYPFTKPLAFVLDWALGDELATTYSSDELLKMFEIHVKENALDKDTANTMTGALTFKDTTVAQVMTPLQNTYLLGIEQKLDFETIAEIFKTGYSRIPVYEVNKVSLLVVKKKRRPLLDAVAHLVAFHACRTTLLVFY